MEKKTSKQTKNTEKKIKKVTEKQEESMSYSELYYKYKVTHTLLEYIGNKLPLFPDAQREIQMEIDQLTAKEREVLNEMRDKIFK